MQICNVARTNTHAHQCIVPFLVFTSRGQVSVVFVSISIERSRVVMADQLRLRGTLKGHGGWVTQIATTPSVPDMILSASRGRSETGTRCAREEREDNSDKYEVILRY